MSNIFFFLCFHNLQCVFGNPVGWVIIGGLNRLNEIFVLFDYLLSESIFVFKTDSGRSKFFLLSVRIIFKGTTKYKSILTKSIIFRINFIKVERNTH